MYRQEVATTTGREASSRLVRGESRNGHRSDGEPRGVARSTSRDDKKTSGSHHAERERGGGGMGEREMLRSVRMASTRVREDLSPWSSLLSSAVSSANEVPRETRRDGSFLFRGRRSSFPRAVSSSWTNCLVTGVRPSLFGTLGIRN